MGLTQDNWITIALVIIPFVVGAFNRIKAKADKADLVKLIDDELKGKMKPVENKVKELELTDKYFHEAIRSIETNNKLHEQRFESLLEVMEKHGEVLEKFSEKMEQLVEKQDIKFRESIGKIYDKIEGLTEKVASKADK